jgi:chemotaxis protein methyltransferase CheR
VVEIPQHLSNLLLRLHGISCSRYDPSFLEKSLQKRMAATACHAVEEYAVLLEHNHEEGKILANSLRISYSGFFRNPLTFAVLERIVLPQLIEQRKKSRRKEIRIWSTACAAGQEVYSLAILLEELHNGKSEDFDYRLFATDHCQEQIDEAQRGQYAASSLQSLSLKRVGAWFSHQGDIYTIDPKLREKTDFSVFDLFSDHLSCPPASIFGDFDLVVCANLLFYYKRPFQKIILEKTTKCLADGGFFVTGEAERDIVSHFNHHEVFPQSGIFRLHTSARSS